MRHLKYSSISIWNETQYRYKGYIVVTTTQLVQATVCDSQSSPDAFRLHRPPVSAHRCLEDPTLDSCVKALKELISTPRAEPHKTLCFSILYIIYQTKPIPYSHFSKLCIQVFIAAWCNGAINCIHLKHNIGKVSVPTACCAMLFTVHSHMITSCYFQWIINNFLYIPHMLSKGHLA